MQDQDFSILFEKIPSTGNKTDISMVSGFNSIVQKINHLFNTNKGELVSDKNFGSDYYVYLFDPLSNKTSLEANLANYIKASITNLSSVKVNLVSCTEDLLEFDVLFSYFDGSVLNENIFCSIEVER